MHRCLAIAASLAGNGLHGQTAARKRLLFLTHAALYKHASLGPAETAVGEWGKTGGSSIYRS